MPQKQQQLTKNSFMILYNAALIKLHSNHTGNSFFPYFWEKKQIYT
jgi:hypothetical protein